MGRRVLGPHVDDDAFTGIRAARGVHDLLPVLPASDQDGLAGAASRVGDCRHQL
ncbi:Uncharacterised protein [Mycobacterium tuberculosis]|uniref:Uncharacterized protein n=1 Tax=Mycobacterium tuberculosis TaxID=1773 RepID=A0A916L8M2_MYCTX|nr:Uncharacterised protein [Mycobacterium tuberculosis]COX19149.1 Uncharacterised protein [Mycobacterium tuberculosis]